MAMCTEVIRGHIVRGPNRNKDEVEVSNILRAPKFSMRKSCIHNSTQRKGTMHDARMLVHSAYPTPIYESSMIR